MQTRCFLGVRAAWPKLLLLLLLLLPLLLLLLLQALWFQSLFHLLLLKPSFPPLASKTPTFFFLESRPYGVRLIAEVIYATRAVWTRRWSVTGMVWMSLRTVHQMSMGGGAI
jgi:hypothetical protein